MMIAKAAIHVKMASELASATAASGAPALRGPGRVANLATLGRRSGATCGDDPARAVDREETSVPLEVDAVARPSAKAVANMSEHPQVDASSIPQEHEAKRGLPSWLTETPYWAISAIVHVILVLIVGAFAVREVRPEVEERQTFVHRIPKPPIYDPKPPKDTKKEVEINRPKTEKQPVIQKKPTVKPEPPKGKPNNKTNVEMLSTLLNETLGSGGGAAGALGDRLNKGNLCREGGSGPTEDAVRAALEWLRRHQHPDGHWSSSDIYTGDCIDPKAYDDDIKGAEGFDVGVTGLALLAFTGFGHTHKFGEHPKYVDVCRKAMRWLLDQQVWSDDPLTNGTIGIVGSEGQSEEGRVYNHAIATMALSELLLLSGDKFKLKKQVEAATQYILEAQTDGLGWRYEYQSAKCDTSVTGWMVLALKTAKVCSQFNLVRLDTEKLDASIQDSLGWFDLATSRSDWRCGYTGPGDPGANWQDFGAPYPYSKELSCMTAVSVLCQIFANVSRRDDLVQGGVNLLMQNPPLWREQRGKSLSTINIYYWYYGSYALMQFGGRKWKEWNQKMNDALLPTQCRLDDKDGSWDPVGEWGAAGGRAYSTAIGALTLEVYYRYRRESEE